MKKFIFILSLLYCFSIADAHAEDEKTVTLTVSGTGSTKGIATQNALRSAIEQAFGAFISSKTEVLNDSLVKDEIVSVTNGNIQKYDIVSEVQIPERGIAITLKAIVSVTKLTSFCESKGVTIEYKGGIFAANMKMQKLNEESEYKTIINLCNTSWEILSKSVDFELQSAKQPILRDKEKQMYSLGFLVTAKTNKNKEIFYKYFNDVISKVSINSDDLEMYKASQIPFFTFRIEDNNGWVKNLYLRNKLSLLALKNLVYKSNRFYFDFLIVSNIDTIYTNELGYNDYANVAFSGLTDYDNISGYLDIFPEGKEAKGEWKTHKVMPFINANQNILYNYYKNSIFAQCMRGDKDQFGYFLGVYNKIIKSKVNKDPESKNNKSWNYEVMNILFDNKYIWLTPYLPNTELRDWESNWLRGEIVYDECFNSDIYTIDKYQESILKIYIEKQYKLEDVEKLSTFKIIPFKNPIL